MRTDEDGNDWYDTVSLPLSGSDPWTVGVTTDSQEQQEDPSLVLVDPTDMTDILVIAPYTGELDWSVV